MLATHCQDSDLLPISCLLTVCDQAYHCIFSKLNYGVGVVLGLQSWVNREYRRGLSMHP